MSNKWPRCVQDMTKMRPIYLRIPGTEVGMVGEKREREIEREREGEKERERYRGRERGRERERERER